MNEIEVVGVRLELPANAPVLVLREVEGRRRLMTIHIGGPEASAIHSALEGIEPPRPLTHDLVGELLMAAGGRIRSVTVSELRDQTYYADIVVETPAGEKTVSGRPSDAIALALRAGQPIYVADAVIDEVGREMPADDEEDGDEEAVVDEFRDFLDTISPEDFSDPSS
ncbi:MAG: hypothetical protein RJB08_170 [Actinomycetota bacterium]|jgi:bifunctional DNase/RNase